MDEITSLERLEAMAGGGARWRPSAVMRDERDEFGVDEPADSMARVLADCCPDCIVGRLESPRFYGVAGTGERARPVDGNGGTVNPLARRRYANGAGCYALASGSTVWGRLRVVEDWWRRGRGVAPVPPLGLEYLQARRERPAAR